MEYDIAVIGEGAAGSLAASLLHREGARVLWLDAGPGPDDPPPTASARTFSHQSASYVFNEETSRFLADDRDLHATSVGADEFQWIHGRGLGGRTLLWQGVCPRFTEREFEPIALGRWTERWPLTLADLEPYYDRVEAHYGLRRFASPEKTRVLEDLRRRLGITIDHCPYIPNYFSDLAADYRGLIERSLAAGVLEGGPGLDYRANTLVTRLRTDATRGVAEAVEAIDLRTGDAHEFSARHFLLAASTLESTRILMNSRSAEHPGGIGSHSDCLGRFLMTHLKGVSLASGTSASGAVAYVRRPEELFYAHHQREFAPEPDFIRGWGLQVRCRGAGESLKFNNFGEDLPDPENRVHLDAEDRDVWGRPRLRIAYRYGANEEKMRRAQVEYMRTIATRLELDAPKISETLANPGRNNHEVGTARMGTNPDTSVLDGESRVWSCPNVRVTDGACFTTSGYQNPTLTILALTWRACDGMLESLRA